VKAFARDINFAAEAGTVALHSGKAASKSIRKESLRMAGLGYNQ
jgi:hypothetical protein